MLPYGNYRGEMCECDECDECDKCDECANVMNVLMPNAVTERGFS